MRKQMISAAVSAALLSASVTAHADVVAQSIFQITGLTISVADGAAGTSGNSVPVVFGSPGAGQVGVVGTQSGDVNSTLNGSALSSGSTPPVTGAPVAINERVCQPAAACAAYAPYTEIGGTPPNGAGSLPPGSLFVNSNSNLNGNVLTLPGGATAEVENTASVPGTNTASANSNTNLNTAVILTLTAPTAFEFFFTANTYVAANITVPGESATAATNFRVQLQQTGTDVVTWSPDGLGGGGVGGSVGGTEFADPFSLQTSISSNLPVLNTALRRGPAVFEMETGTLAPGAYQLTIDQGSSVNVTSIPEPATLALTGLGLLGLGMARRSRKRAA